MYLKNCKLVYDGDSCVITGPCVVTGKDFTVSAKTDDVLDYLEGAMVQDCFPYLSQNDREFLISGFSPEGWDLTFGEE